MHRHAKNASEGEDVQSLQLAGGCLDLRTGAFATTKGAFQLTPLELALAAYLGGRPEEVVSRAELLRVIWGYAPNVRTRAVDDTVKRLRSKTEAGGHIRQFQSVRGLGLRYRPLRGVCQAAEVSELETRVRLDRGWLGLDSGRMVYVDGDESQLSEKELTLLGVLFAAHGRWVNSEALGRGRKPGRALDNVLYRLRKKLERDPSHPKTILRCRTRGIKLVVENHHAGGTLMGRHALLTDALARLGAGCSLQLVGGPGVGLTALLNHLEWQQGLRTVCLASDGSGLEHLDARPPVLVIADLDVVPSPETMAEWSRYHFTGVRFAVTSPIRLSIPWLDSIRVHPIDDTTAQAMLQRRTISLGGQPCGPVEAYRFAALTGGRPLAVELLAWWTSSHSLRGVPSILPIRRPQDHTPPLRASIARAWQRVGRQARRLWLATSTRPEPVPLGTIAARLGFGAADAHVGVDELVENGLARFDGAVHLDPVMRCWARERLAQPVS